MHSKIAKRIAPLLFYRRAVRKKKPSKRINKVERNRAWWEYKKKERNISFEEYLKS